MDQSPNIYREITEFERQILLAMANLAEQKFQAEIKRQILDAEVRVVDSYGSLLIKVKQASVDCLCDGPISNAIMNDEDTVENYGPFVNFILFSKGGFIDELQIYRDDAEPVRVNIDPEKIKSF